MNQSAYSKEDQHDDLMLKCHQKARGEVLDSVLSWKRYDKQQKFLTDYVKFGIGVSVGTASLESFYEWYLGFKKLL